jgi:hypothetical protein
LIFFSLLSFFSLQLPHSHAQTSKDHEELMRLRDKAEEAMSVGDPQTAASNTGKAALLASLMAKNETRPTFRLQLESLEGMFRTQEQVYQSIALFRQSGEHVPASSGVCKTITLASSHRTQAEKIFSTTQPVNPLFESLPVDLREWKEIIEELQTEFGCVKKTGKKTSGHQGR